MTKYFKLVFLFLFFSLHVNSGTTFSSGGSFGPSNYGVGTGSGGFSNSLGLSPPASGGEDAPLNYLFLWRDVDYTLSTTTDEKIPWNVETSDSLSEFDIGSTDTKAIITESSTRLIITNVLAVNSQGSNFDSGWALSTDSGSSWSNKSEQGRFVDSSVERRYNTTINSAAIYKPSVGDYIALNVDPKGTSSFGLDVEVPQKSHLKILEIKERGSSNGDQHIYIEKTATQAVSSNASYTIAWDSSGIVQDDDSMWAGAGTPADITINENDDHDGLWLIITSVNYNDYTDSQPFIEIKEKGGSALCPGAYGGLSTGAMTACAYNASAAVTINVSTTNWNASSNTIVAATFSAVYLGDPTTWDAKEYLYAKPSASSSITASTYEFTHYNSEITSSGAYNTSTGEYTVPSDGKYLILQNYENIPDGGTTTNRRIYNTFYLNAAQDFYQRVAADLQDFNSGIGGMFGLTVNEYSKDDILTQAIRVDNGNRAASTNSYKQIIKIGD